MNNIFSERLAPIRAHWASQRAAVRPISRVWFELSDRAAFDQCIDLSLRWMRPRARVTLPTHAWEGGTFDVTDVLGANPAKAVRIDAADGALWAARLDYPDPIHPRTWVSEFFTERRDGQLCRFGAQLTCVIRGESPPHETTRPTVVRHVLEGLSAEADSWPLADKAAKLGKDDIPAFENLLYDVARRLPIVAISESDEGRTRVRPDTLAREIAGAAHIFHLSSEASWELTRTLGKRMSVFGGAVRIYLPGLSDTNEDPYQHPLWLLGESDERDFTKAMAARILPMAFIQSAGREDFPRFAALRDAAARRALAQRPSSTAIEKLQSEFDVLKIEYGEIAEEREAWQGLAQEEQNQRLASDAEIERLKAEIIRLEAKSATLEHYLKTRPQNPIEQAADFRHLDSFDDLEEWSEEVLGDHIYIHQAALKDCKKNGHANTLERIEQALLVIRDYVVPSRILGGLERRDLAREKLGEIGMEDTPCFVDRDEAKRTTGYSVKYEGDTWILYDHIKYGNGYDNANQIRIYYFWDETRKRLVIGKMPSHLRNNLTS